jgi:hypothetical protein
VAKKIVINNVLAADVDAFCDAWKVEGRDERKLLRDCKAPRCSAPLSHILPLAHIYASGKRSRLTLAIFIQQCLNWGMLKLWRNNAVISELISLIFSKRWPLRRC